MDAALVGFCLCPCLCPCLCLCLLEHGRRQHEGLGDRRGDARGRGVRWGRLGRVHLNPQVPQACVECLTNGVDALRVELEHRGGLGLVEGVRGEREGAK